MTNEQHIVDAIKSNREEFQSILLSEAGDVSSKIQSILEEGNIDLLKNAEKIVFYIIEGDEEELIDFAKLEGKAWAKHDLTLALKLEWIHALRRTLWILLKKYNPLNHHSATLENFFELEKKINDGIDKFLNNFFVSYTKYKDELILEQRKLVEHLTVPIIPISSHIAVLLLIGKFDSYRMNIIEEKVLSEIARMEIETLMIDLSGIPDIDEYNLASLERVLSGVAMMGGSAVLTGLRPKLARKMVSYRQNYGGHYKVKGTLQKALSELLPEK